MVKLTDLTIPMMGSVENARLLKWFIDEGSSFARGDILYELETDKTVTEVEADADGILARRLAAEGDEFKMGDRVGLQAPAGSSSDAIAAALAALASDDVAGDENEIASKNAPAESPATAASSTRDEQRPVPEQAVASPTDAIKVKSSPRSRKLAREHGIDISSLKGTGPRGRVTGEDVLKAAAALRSEPALKGNEGESASTKPLASVVPEAGSTDGAEVIPHSMRRKTIARNMAASKRDVPHLTADMDIDLSNLMALRKRYKANGQPAPSILSYFATTAARLLMEHKALNATFRENDMLLWKSVNLNIGIDTDDGLVVPVIRDAQNLTAAEMTVTIANLAERARQGKLTAQEMSGGTFTISNPGSLGPVVRAEAVLNGPQVALLGMPGIVKRPVAIEMSDGSYAIQIKPMIRVGVTFDHRALDGGPVIRFLNSLKFAIEHIDT